MWYVPWLPREFNVPFASQRIHKGLPAGVKIWEDTAGRENEM